MTRVLHAQLSCREDVLASHGLGYVMPPVKSNSLECSPLAEQLLCPRDPRLGPIVSKPSLHEKFHPRLTMSCTNPSAKHTGTAACAPSTSPLPTRCRDSCDPRGRHLSACWISARVCAEEFTRFLPARSLSIYLKALRGGGGRYPATLPKPNIFPESAKICSLIWVAFFSTASLPPFFNSAAISPSTAFLEPMSSPL
jgi:hypothetical protein